MKPFGVIEKTYRMYQLSSPAHVLALWVRIPWIHACVYSVFVLSCVQVGALRRTDLPSKESYRLHKNQETEKGTKVQRRAVEP
jgi:hypothetical protein